MLLISLAFGDVFHFPFSLVTMGSQITCWHTVSWGKLTAGWGIVENKRLSGLLASLVHVHFIWFRNFSWRDWPSSLWGLVQLDYPDVGVFTARIVLHLSCFFPDDLLLKMTLLGCAVTSVSSGLREFLVLNLQISGCLESSVSSSLPVLSWEVLPLDLQKSHQVFLVLGFPAQVSCGVECCG